MNGFYPVSGARMPIKAFLIGQVLSPAEVTLREIAMRKALSVPLLRF
jgi:hypothetical protein